MKQKNCAGSLTKKRKKYIQRNYRILLKNIRRNLSREKRKQGLTWKMLSQKSNLSISELKSLFYDEPKPRISELFNIAKTLNLGYKEIFICGGRKK